MSSLRSRLALLVGALAAALALVAALVVAQQAWQRSEANAIDQVVNVAVDVDLLVAGQADRGEPIELDEPPRRFGVALFDIDGSPTAVAGSLDEPAAFALGARLDITFADEFSFVTDEVDGAVVAATACFEPAACHAVLATRAGEPLADYLTDRIGWLLLIVASIALLAALATRWIVGRSLAPVDRMRAELDEITASDLGRRVPVPPDGHELADLGASFNRTIQRLADGVEAQQRFTSDAAHELRSPLTGLRATLELTHHQPERAADSLAVAISEVDRASRLVDDLLVLARRNGDQSAPIRRATDLDDITRTELAALARRTPNLSIDRSRVEPVQAAADPAAIARIIRNLLDNAATHAAAQVRAELVTVGDRWELRIDDDGPGVPVADRERIFDRFTRLDESRSRDTGGSGLGLAIVRELVEEHDGHVSVGDSELGGASFVVRAPVSRGG